MLKIKFKFALIGVVIALFIMIALNLIMASIFSSSPTAVSREFSYSSFIANLEQGNVADVTLRGLEIGGLLKDGGRFVSYAPSGQFPSVLTERLLAENVTITVIPDPELSVLAVFVSWLPLMILLAGMWFAVGRPMLIFVRRLDAYLNAIYKQSSIGGSPGSDP